MSRAATIDRTGPRVSFDAWRDADGWWRVAAAATVAVATVGIVALINEVGGAPTPFVHLLYLPVALGAIVFKLTGGAVAGAAAGVVLGVFASAEPVADWSTRAVLLATVGALFGHAQDHLQRRQRQGRDLLEKLSTVHARTLSTFAATVDLRDRPTSGHSSRVAHNARAVAIGLGMDGERLRAVYWAGLLHDLGKIAVPERILQKPGALSEDEFTTMRRHSDIGANLLLSVSPDLRPIAEGVRTHHERWDGSGYPRQLREDEIPLTGRIVSVVDVFEALTCARPYRGPRPVAEVLQFIRDRSGSWFDPDLVSLLEDLYWQGNIFTAAAVRTQLPVEEPAVVVADDPVADAILRVAHEDYHLGSSGRP